MGPSSDAMTSRQFTHKFVKLARVVLPVCSRLAFSRCNPPLQVQLNANFRSAVHGKRTDNSPVRNGWQHPGPIAEHEAYSAWLHLDAGAIGMYPSILDVCVKEEKYVETQQHAD